MHCFYSVNTFNVVARYSCQIRATSAEASTGSDLSSRLIKRRIPKETDMTGSDKQQTTNEPHRSFVVSDFSMRDIPFTLLAFSVFSVASSVMGLVVESLTSFWRGFLFGIAAAMAGVIGLSQIPGPRVEKK
ncbi:MAG: hypothetical protein RIK87_16190 [Fuerstiella sp.]